MAMKNLSDLRLKFENRDVNNFSLSDFYDECSETISLSIQSGGEYYLLTNENGEGFNNVCTEIANWFNALKFDLIITIFDQLATLQKQENRRIYRATLAKFLAKNYLLIGDKGAAIRWGFIGLADDILGSHARPTHTANYQLLNTDCGIHKSILRIFEDIAKENLANINDNWSQSVAFAEDVLVKFVSSPEAREVSHVLAESSRVSEFPLIPAYFESLFTRLEKTSSNNNDGKALEDIATYLCLLISSWLPMRNLKQPGNNSETDVMISNLNPLGNLNAELLGRHFLVECKDLNNAVGVQQVGYFLYRMHLLHTHFGILFASNGITGDKTGDNAKYLLSRAFNEDRLTCIVVTKDDLEKLKKQEISFGTMIVAKMNEFRFGKP